MTLINRRFLLASRPVGDIDGSNFHYDEAPVPEPDEGQFVVRNEWLSLDPAMRGWMSAGRSYIAPVEIGSVMRGFAAGRIVASRNPAYAEGTYVTGLFGWQEYALSDGTSDGKGIRRALPGVPLSTMLSALGLPGLTAYFGLLDVGRPKGGETVVVSAAAGGVGSIVVQIAKILGCRVVGIAGAPDKCDFVRSLGADACIDYKNDDVGAGLKAACPKGIDVYFDNVGGDILDQVLRRLNLGARVSLCGGISQYNSARPQGPAAYLSLLANRASMAGFIYFDYTDRFDEAETALAAWLQRGWIQHRDEVVEGLESAPSALLRLFDGSNRGKLLVRIAAEGAGS